MKNVIYIMTTTYYCNFLIILHSFITPISKRIFKKELSQRDV